jgi:two-component sensor histidine kinase
MALHELVTNAVKYGALSDLTGRVEVEWVMRCADQGRRLRFVWAERDGPIVQRPTRKGFRLPADRKWTRARARREGST